MLAVHKGQLMIEEKGIYTTEKFLVSRRLMYWQVYLHKTVISAEKMLVQTIRRAKELVAKKIVVPAISPPLDFFLKTPSFNQLTRHDLDLFCRLDDYDVLGTIKNWMFHPDKVLSTLCRCLVDRRLFKVKLQADPFKQNLVEELKENVSRCLDISHEESQYFVFEGQAENTTYDPSEERIDILFRDGTIKDISQVDNALIHHNLASPVKKFYICYLRCA
jgi:HD superfamily phosphohydrolase